MSCCTEYIIKYILFAVNLIFMLGGLTLLILGILVQLQVSDTTVANGYLAPISSMVVGSTILIIAFFGCCGAIAENKCFLLTYAILMVVLMIVKVTIGIVIFTGRNSVLEDVIDWLTETFNNNRYEFYEIQSTFRCCGTTGPIVYLPGALPASCCLSPPCNVNNAFEGCFTIVHDFFDTYWVVIGIVLFVLAGIELIAAIFGFCLSSHISNKQSVQVVNSS